MISGTIKNNSSTTNHIDNSSSKSQVRKLCMLFKKYYSEKFINIIMNYKSIFPYIFKRNILKDKIKKNNNIFDKNKTKIISKTVTVPKYNKHLSLNTKICILLSKIYSENIVNAVVKYFSPTPIKYVNNSVVTKNKKEIINGDNVSITISKKKFKQHTRIDNFEHNVTGKIYSQQERIGKIKNIKIEMIMLDILQHLPAKANAMLDLYEKMEVDIEKDFDIPIIQHCIIIRLYKHKGRKSYVNFKRLSSSTSKMTKECRKFLVEVAEYKKQGTDLTKNPNRI